jgi:IS5 family transposase
MAKTVFRKWDAEQAALFPPSVRDLVPADHLVHFVRKLVVEDLDLDAVDAADQVVTAADVTAQQNDAAQLAPMLEQIEANTGAKPEQVSADAGYCSEENIAAVEEKKVDAYVATGRQKHGTPSATGDEDKRAGPRTTAMREKLRAGGWKSPYRLRRQTVEPVFGQIKEARGFRRFLHRGLAKVRAEWRFVCAGHNVLKLAARKAAERAAVARTAIA